MEGRRERERKVMITVEWVCHIHFCANCRLEEEEVNFTSHLVDDGIILPHETRQVSA